MQKRAAHIILASNSDYSLLFRTLKWKTFSQIREYFCRIFIYKSLNKLNANSCHQLFEHKISQIKTKEIRRKELILPNSSLQCFLNTIFYTGIKAFNALDPNVRDILNFNSFVKTLKNL